jgi:hypothetical protein
MLLAAALLVHPGMVATSAAQEPVVEETAEGDAGKLVDYALCAVSILAASTGVGAALAVLTCAKAAITWWSE